ncbi:Hypothetical predicted protein [Paramuricea clavata]|uniref:Uncharacterized protein n=1 Tax=Paramuricea clavata TaxID=317549 RepID=A0A6S7HL91_PARCT|nr:Hypothetical predicted protein [Paramuricea clavata]
MELKGKDVITVDKQQNLPMDPRRSGRERNPPTYYHDEYATITTAKDAALYVAEIEEPETLKGALDSEYTTQWKAAADADKLTIVTVHVDDLILLTDTEEEMIDLKTSLANHFKMKDMGVLHYCLGRSSVFRYLKGTAQLRLQYQETDANVEGYSDADWASDSDDRRSTSGNVFVMSGGAISWASKKQPTVALSTSESEYIALCFATQEAVWLRQLMKDLQMECTTATTIYEDNQGDIAMSRNPVLHKRTKHIDIKYNFVREKTQDETIELKYCPTNEMVADILTKPLSKGQFEYLRYPGVFIRVLKDKLTIVTVHVDDLILLTDTEEEMIDLKTSLANHFKMKDMGVLHYCLGVSVTIKDGVLQISQEQVHR